MKKHFRLIISSLCLGALLFAAFILAVNLYVQSKDMQERIRTGLSDAVGMPVGVFRTTFSPWGGFRLDRIRIKSDVPKAAHDFLHAECLEVRCEFIPLVQGRVVVRRIALDAPQFVLQKNERNQFRFPSEEGPEPKARPVVVPGAGVVRKATPTPRVLADASPTVSPTLKAILPEGKPDIRKLLLRDGNFRFLAADGSEILRLEMVRCSLNAKAVPNTFAGPLEIKRAVLMNRWELIDVEAAISLDKQHLRIEKISGLINDGHIAGAITADLGAAGQPYSARLRLTDAQVAQFFPKDSDYATDVKGTVHARLEFDGFLTQEEKNKGHAELKISRAEISDIPMLKVLGQVVRSQDMANLTIKKVEIKADMAGPHTKITSSYLQSPHVEVKFSGAVDPARNLDLQAQLVVSAALFKKLPTEARENFVEVTGTEQRMLDFTINGPLVSPRTNLVNRLIGDKLQKKLRGFLGGDEPEPSPGQ
ncbi:MAG TPA: AsmA-like C-terminal region-containing protein [Chthoniobacterales bacterium]